MLENVGSVSLNAIPSKLAVWPISDRSCLDTKNRRAPAVCTGALEGGQVEECRTYVVELSRMLAGMDADAKRTTLEELLEDKSPLFGTYLKARLEELERYGSVSDSKGTTTTAGIRARLERIRLTHATKDEVPETLASIRARMRGVGG